MRKNLNVALNAAIAAQLACFIVIIMSVIAGVFGMHASGDASASSLRTVADLVAYLAIVFGLVGLYARKSWARWLYTTGVLAMMLVACLARGNVTIDAPLLLMCNVEHILHGVILTLAWSLPSETVITPAAT